MQLIDCKSNCDMQKSEKFYEVDILPVTGYSAEIYFAGHYIIIVLARGSFWRLKAKWIF